MPRKARKHYRHAFYHVMLRGNNKQQIFYEESDQLRLYHILAKAKEQYGCRLHLFCFMPNHIHLVIEVGNITLAKVMNSVVSSYARRFNKRHQRIGHVFQGRYLAKHVHNDDYMLELCHYIHMNPLKAQLVRDLNDYPWSSHHAYMGRRHVEWITTTHIKNLLQSYLPVNKHHYQEFMYNRPQTLMEPKFCELDNDGNLTITESINSCLNSKKTLSLENIPLREIAEIICEHIGVPTKQLTSYSQNRKVSLARTLIAYYGHYHAKYFLRDIALIFGRRPETISRNMNRYLKNAENNQELMDLMCQLERKLSVPALVRLQM